MDGVTLIRVALIFVWLWKTITVFRVGIIIENVEMWNYIEEIMENVKWVSGLAWFTVNEEFLFMFFRVDVLIPMLTFSGLWMF